MTYTRTLLNKIIDNKHFNMNICQEQYVFEGLYYRTCKKMAMKEITPMTANSNEKRFAFSLLMSSSTSANTWKKSGEKNHKNSDVLWFFFFNYLWYIMYFFLIICGI